jgi:hypothetical protein
MLSYLAAFGLRVLLFRDAVGDDGLNFFLQTLMFVFLPACPGDA